MNTKVEWYAGVTDDVTPRAHRRIIARLSQQFGREGAGLRTRGATIAERAFLHGAEIGGGPITRMVPWGGAFDTRPEDNNVMNASHAFGATFALAVSANHDREYSTRTLNDKLHMACIVFQLLGEDLSNYAKSLICYSAPSDSGLSLSRFAIKVAEGYGIPVINLHSSYQMAQMMTWLDIDSSNAKVN